MVRKVFVKISHTGYDTIKVRQCCRLRTLILLTIITRRYITAYIGNMKQAKNISEQLTYY